MLLLAPWLHGSRVQYLDTTDQHSLDTAPRTTLLGRKQVLGHAPRVPLPPLAGQALARAVGILSPFGHGLRDAPEGILVAPVQHTRGIDADEADAGERVAEGAVVAVDEALALEGVADDGDARRPLSSVVLPELDQAEEHVVVRVQRPRLGHDAAGLGRLRQDPKVRVGGREVVVALRLAFLRLLACWATVKMR